MAFPNTGVLDDFNSGAAQNLTARSGWAPGVFWPGDDSLVTDSGPTYATTDGVTTFCSNTWGTTFTDSEVWITWGSVIATTYIFARVTFPAGLISGYGFGWVDDNTYALSRYANGGFAEGYLGGSMTRVAGDSWGLRVYDDPSFTNLEAWYKPVAGAWTLLGTGLDFHTNQTGRLGVEMKNLGRLDSFNGGGTTLRELSLTGAGA